MQRRKFIVTMLSSTAVTQLAMHGSKRVRAKYRNAITFCADDNAVALTGDGFGVIARLSVGWFTLRVETHATGVVPVETGREAMALVRRAPLMLLGGEP